MASKKEMLNETMDKLIREVAKDKGYKIAKKETDVTSGTYGIEINDEEVFFFIYVDVYKDSDMVTFTTVVDNLTPRAEKFGMSDIYSLYKKIAATSAGYSFALREGEDGENFVEFRYTALRCSDADAISLGIDTCVDASCDYIQGLEEELGLKY